MKKERRKREFEDDGRVIADMNVDGMPWYSGKRTGNQNKEDDNFETLDKKQTFWMIMGVLGAALLVAAVFVVGYLLLILFCENVWFK